MTREELLALKVEALRQRAAERGLPNARTLGKSELVDALAGAAPLEPKLAPAAKPTPEEPPSKRRRHPARGGFDVPSSTVHPHADELETLTMARLYVAEGQLDRALEIFVKLLELDPDDEAIRAQVTALREKRATPTTPASAPPTTPSAPQEPFGMIDFEELPETYGFDECEVLYKDPFWAFAYWEVTEAGVAAARAQLGPSSSSARLVLRLFTTLATAAGSERHLHDLDLNWNHGRRYFQAPEPGAHLRVAVGLLSVEGYFAPIAHSSLVRVPPAVPGPVEPVEWMEVVAGKSRGLERDPIVIVRRGQGHAERGASAASASAPAEGPSSTRPRGGPAQGSGSPTGGRS